MENIDKYLDSLLKNDKSKESKELKLEIKLHLLDSVKDLKDSGYSEKDAINEAISRFHDDAEMIREFKKTRRRTSSEKLKIKTKLLGISKKLFLVSLILTLFLGIICNNYWISWEETGSDIGIILDKSTNIINNKDKFKEYIDTELKNNKNYKNLVSLEIYDNIHKSEINKLNNSSNYLPEYKYYRYSKGGTYQGSGFSSKETTNGKKTYYTYAIDNTTYIILSRIGEFTFITTLLSLIVYLIVLIPMKLKLRFKKNSN